jgi:hypothetical protein
VSAEDLLDVAGCDAVSTVAVEDDVVESGDDGLFVRVLEVCETRMVVAPAVASAEVGDEI